MKDFKFSGAPLAGLVLACIAVAAVAGYTVRSAERPKAMLMPDPASMMHPTQKLHNAASLLASCTGAADCARCRDCSECAYCKTAAVKCGRHPLSKAAKTRAPAGEIERRVLGD